MGSKICLKLLNDPGQIQWHYSLQEFVANSSNILPTSTFHPSKLCSLIRELKCLCQSATCFLLSSYIFLSRIDFSVTRSSICFCLFILDRLADSLFEIILFLLFSSTIAFGGSTFRA
ncbi:hypothetical protein OIU78_005055 [Salix suchowensis]|nr:hypothetical protein OIU78_005055 [Salix suchowensis]